MRALYLDACPMCDHRNLAFPTVVLEVRNGVACMYECDAGHEWTCNWADEEFMWDAS